MGRREKNGKRKRIQLSMLSAMLGEAYRYLSFPEIILLQSVSKEFKQSIETLSEVSLSSSSHWVDSGVFQSILNTSLCIEKIASFNISLHEWNVSPLPQTSLEEKEFDISSNPCTKGVAEIIFRNSSFLRQLHVSTWDFRKFKLCKIMVLILMHVNAFDNLSSLSLKLHSITEIGQKQRTLSKLIRPDRFPSLSKLELSIPISTIPRIIKELLKSKTIYQLKKLTIESHDEDDRIDVWGTIARYFGSSPFQFTNLRYLELSFAGLGHNQHRLSNVLLEKFPTLKTLAISPCQNNAFENLGLFVKRSKCQNLFLEMAPEPHSPQKSNFKKDPKWKDVNSCLYSLCKSGETDIFSSLKSLYLFDITETDFLCLCSGLQHSTSSVLSCLYIDFKVRCKFDKEKADAMAFLLQHCPSLKKLFITADCFCGLQNSETFVETACSKLMELSLGPSLSNTELQMIFDGICMDATFNLMKFYFQPCLKDCHHFDFPYTGPNGKEIQLLTTDLYRKKMNLCNTISVGDFQSVVIQHEIKGTQAQTSKDREILLYSSEVSLKVQ